jgi:hypothetical protein
VDHVFVAGSKSSVTAARALQAALTVQPPVTKTWPVFKSVAEWAKRGTASEPAGDQLPVAGL